MPPKIAVGVARRHFKCILPTKGVLQQMDGLRAPVTGLTARMGTTEPCRTRRWRRGLSTWKAKAKSAPSLPQQSRGNPPLLGTTARRGAERGMPSLKVSTSRPQMVCRSSPISPLRTTDESALKVGVESTHRAHVTERPSPRTTTWSRAVTCLPHDTQLSRPAVVKDAYPSVPKP